MAAGRHAFEWDASSYNGSGNPTFTITATSGNKPIASTALARDTVVAIGNKGIELKGRDPVSYDSVLAIL